jgi:hypothetical protein
VIVGADDPWIMGACGAKAGWAMGWYWYVGATVAGACGATGALPWPVPQSGWNSSNLGR